MEKIFEASGKTVEEALDAACALAGVGLNEAEVEVVEVGSKGIFGIGGKDARVRLIVNSAGEEAARPTITEVEPKVPEAARTPKKPIKAQDKPQFVKPELKEKNNLAVSAEERIAEEPQIILSPEEVEDATAKTLSFLEPIFAKMQVAPKHSVQYREGLVVLSFNGENLGVLIGRRGETLNALQYLVNLFVNKTAKQHVRVVLDVENYRASREETLIALARKMAEKAVRTGRRVELEPMNPHERRIVHISLQGDNRVETISRGEEPYRRVVIVKKGGRPYRR